MGTIVAVRGSAAGEAIRKKLLLKDRVNRRTWTWSDEKVYEIKAKKRKQVRGGGGEQSNAGWGVVKFGCQTGSAGAGN